MKVIHIKKNKCFSITRNETLHFIELFNATKIVEKHIQDMQIEMHYCNPQSHTLILSLFYCKINWYFTGSAKTLSIHVV